MFYKQASEKGPAYFFSFFELLPIIGTLVKKKDMARNTSISLGDHFEKFIDQSIHDGRFSNASEVIRAGLRLLEEDEHKIKSLKKAIKQGVDSGRVADFNAELHLAALKSRKK